MSENIEITKFGTAAGKGDKLRPVNEKKFRDNWDKIFGKKEKKDDNGASNQEG